MRPVHVNPPHVKKSKEMDDNDPSKNNRKDSKVIAGLENEGRYFYPYISDGIYTEIGALSGRKVLAQSEIIRLTNWMGWFSIYFSNNKDIYENVGAFNVNVVTMPEDIALLGVDGVNRIWKDAKVRGAGMKRAKILITMAEHSVGNSEDRASNSSI